MKDKLLDAKELKNLVKKIYTAADMIRIHRERLEWSEENLAEKANLSVALVKAYESGSPVSYKDAVKLAAALEIHQLSILDPF